MEAGDQAIEEKIQEARTLHYKQWDPHSHVDTSWEKAYTGAAVASLPAEVPASSNEETPARATRSMELEDAFEEGHIRAAEYHERLLAGETTVDVPVD